MPEKSLLTKLAETLEQHRAERQATLARQSGTVSVPQQMHHVRWWLPTPGNVIFTLILLVSLLWAQSVGAISLGAPALATTSTAGIPYQGRLADKNGAPLTQTVNMIFRLYAAASGGSPLWEEQWTGANSVQVSDGLFNVMLGSLTPIPQTVITGNNNLFLGITVGTDSEMSPRVQLGSVPFATQALTMPDGSIKTATLADGAVTKAKLDPAISFEPLYEFGGMYVVNPHTGACQSNNPFTNGCMCPATFSTQVVGSIPHGVNGFDCNGVLCYSYMCSK